MGTDIHIHLEYRSRKTKQYKYGGKIRGERIYDIFDAMALDEDKNSGDVFFQSRGLPGDVTQATLKEYRMWKENAHHASWLSTIEFSACIVEAYIRMNSFERLQFLKQYEELFTIINTVFLKSKKQEEDCLLSYKELLKLMISYEEDQEECRIVFWFDN